MQIRFAAGTSNPISLSHLAVTVTEAERAGFDTFVLPDHPSMNRPLFAAAHAVLAASESIGVEFFALNAALRPLESTLCEIRGLEALHGERLTIAVGLGTPHEWACGSRTWESLPSFEERLARVETFVARSRECLSKNLNNSLRVGGSARRIAELAARNGLGLALYRESTRDLSATPTVSQMLTIAQAQPARCSSSVLVRAMCVTNRRAEAISLLSGRFGITT